MPLSRHHRLHVVAAAAILASIAVHAVIASFPPGDASWTRMNGSTPVLPPSQPWESNCTCENVVWMDPASNVLRMIYRGGWASCGIGYAESSDNGATWTKYANNPVYGHGGSGINSSPGEPWVVNNPPMGGLLLYTTDNSIPAMNVSHSMDALTWTPLPQAHIELPPTGRLWGNRVVWLEPSLSPLINGGPWMMLHEVMVDNGPWETFLYSSPDALVWSIENNGQPLISLQVFPGGMYGGPRFARIGADLTPRSPVDGLYHLWYHAASAGGGLPTDIWHATSSDLFNWTVTPRTPVLTHIGGGSFEHDQVAGPVPLIIPASPNQALMFYDGDNNVLGSCAVGGATALAASSSLAMLDGWVAAAAEAAANNNNK